MVEVVQNEIYSSSRDNASLHNLNIYCVLWEMVYVSIYIMILSCLCLVHKHTLVAGIYQARCFPDHWDQLGV